VASVEATRLTDSLGRTSRGKRIVAALVICTAAGALFEWLRSPLPWMIGPLVAMAAFRFGGVDLLAPPGAGPVGQLLIGTALGLFFTPPVAREVVANWSVFVAAGLFSWVVAYLCGLILWKTTDTDATTAFLASVPGGATEMANLGARLGGQVERIAVAQSVRIMVVVIVIPFTLAFLGVQGADTYESVRAPEDWTKLAGLIALGVVAALVFRLFRAPNGWVFGPLVVTIALTANGIEWSAMPKVLTNVAQVLIGCNLGQRFQREFMRKAPWFVAMVCVSVVVALAISALFALGLARVAGLTVATMVVATAPGGMAEMCLTAKNLQLGVPLVTAAHVARVLMLVGLTGPIFRLTRWFRRRH
jgi:uncharacterized protein